MIEVIKHSLGICGESHPSILLLLIGGLAPVAFYINNIKVWCKTIFKK